MINRLNYFADIDIYKGMKSYTNDLPRNLHKYFTHCSFLFEKKDGFELEEFTKLDFIPSLNEHLPYIPYRFVRSTLMRINVPTPEIKNDEPRSYIKNKFMDFYNGLNDKEKQLVEHLISHQLLFLYWLHKEDYHKATFHILSFVETLEEIYEIVALNKPKYLVLNDAYHTYGKGNRMTRDHFIIKG